MASLTVRFEAEGGGTIPVFILDMGVVFLTGD